MGLKTCCFCVDLRLGAFISGYMVLLYNIGMSVAHSLTLYSLAIMLSQEEMAMLLDMSAIPSIVVSFIGFLLLLITIVLLVGLHKSKQRLILVSIILTAICLTLELVLTLLIIFNSPRMWYMDWIRIVMQKILTIIYVYFLCVIGSYRKKMCQEGSDMDGSSKTYYA